ncbi:MAG: hypothetical protein C5B47_01570 [Verrucomicrobia bacterium]|nr:MAG: hypothetical protein C5B47_01570 [Verrucomicrobiota bacterium]
MPRPSAFSLCELLVALGLAAALLALCAEGIFLIRKIQSQNLAATRALLRARYFLEVECREILRAKKKDRDFSEEFFFRIGPQGLLEISRHQFDFGDTSDTTLVHLRCLGERERSAPVSVRVRFESPGHLPQIKRRIYEVHTAFFENFEIR